MILDEDDLKILKKFIELGRKKEFTTWKLMKSIYPDGRDTEHMRIRTKMERMAKYGLFIVQGNPKVYYLIKKNILLDKIPKIENCISIKANGKWEIFEL